MKNVFLLFLGFALFACGGEATTDQSTEVDTPEETQSAPETSESKASDIIEGDGFVIKVINGELPSPRKEMSTAVGGADIVVNYGSPSIKGREIWGGLEPYGEVWRTGANEATTFAVSAPIKVEGEVLEAGKYALFTIPNEDEWTVIFNAEPDQWGDYKYDETKDVLRVVVKPTKIEEHVEAMEFIVEGETIVLKWGAIAVPFAVAANS